ncbi:MAG TPA: class I tRNA ligase family protein [Acidimicrobiales bacterium]
MGAPYDVAAVEHRWQARWAADRAHEVDPDTTPPDRAFYNLVEFPYPSAAGLHVGHALSYTGADVLGRYQRRRGRAVFQPIGFDAFGINAENYALLVGEHPATLVARTTAIYRRQLAALGGGWSWDATLTTSDPAYYRGTQWVFLRLLEAGLAYRAAAPVLWCPSCRTVLAREQVEHDRCERCGARVVERTMTQWFLRTTAYADRLAAGLGGLDWPAKAKNRQRRWIAGLHDWLISRQRYWGPPIPVVHCGRCGVVPVPDDELPVELPSTDDPAAIRPTDGRPPLAAFPDWVHVPCPRCGGPAERETDVSDTFLDSAWYFLRYPTVAGGGTTTATAGTATGTTAGPWLPWDPDRTARWLPVDHYAGGPEHVTRHHLYARFVTMALHDRGLVPVAEPFPRLRLHGIVTTGGAKMSKSRGNVVNPDGLVAAHGADVTRLALLSARPWDTDGDWDPDPAITGAERFVARLWRLVTAPPGDGHADVGPTARRVTDGIERLACNTSIAALMALVGQLRGHGRPAHEVRDALVSLAAPFVPHVAEELWHRLGHTTSVHAQPWPVT